VATHLGSVAAASQSAGSGELGDALHHCSCPPACRRRKKSTPRAEHLGRSRGGLTTKIHARVDGDGRLFTLILTPGQQHESTVAERLMSRGAIGSGSRGRPRLRPKRLIADKAYGSRRFKHWLRQRGIQPVIPRKVNQPRGRPYNPAWYRQRNVIERFFGRLKHFRAVATRYDKRSSTYLATVLLASIVLCL
jgi:transposase